MGSPIVDVLARVDDSFVATVAGDKGGMVLVEAEAINALVARLPGGSEIAPGGSAGNTTFAATRLGLRTTFLGKIGNDEAARFFAESFTAIGGDATRLLRAPLPNARCLSLVTPDSARTMRTCLGAAMTLDPAEISVNAFRDCRHAHIEGYLLFNDSLMRAVLEAARAADCTVSLDLGSFEVVGAARERLPDLLREYVDIVFANEEEAAALLGTELSHEEKARQLAALCGLGVVKLGAAGSLVAEASGEVTRIAPVFAAHPVDTTGAGDFWAAGFLFGWLRGWPLARCGAFGSRLGAEVVQIMGTVLPAARWAVIEAERG